MKLALITPTRNRPRSFALVEKAMMAQSEPWGQWMVVNDGPELYHTMAPAIKQGLFQRFNGPANQHPLCSNVINGLANVNAEFIAIIEDDDAYLPDYLATLVDAMTPGIDLVGLAPAHYYHLPSRRWECCNNRAHASLGMSMFRASLIPEVLAICDMGKPFIDIPLWARVPTHAKRLIPSAGSDGRLLHVGLKGCPGEPGIGVGHRKPLRNLDPSGSWLRHQLGTEAEGWLGLMPSPKKPTSSAAGS